VDADAFEEVTLSKSSKSIWADIFNGPLIHDARRDHVAGDQFAAMLRRRGRFRCSRQ
jgi:hypothetical protein